MNDSRYEQVKADLRYRIWREIRKSNEIIASFYQRPEGFRKLFDMLVKFYTRVREAVLGIEEMWIFLIESIFNQELTGNLLFEQYHKQLFKKEILQNKYLSAFIKELKDSNSDRLGRLQ